MMSYFRKKKKNRKSYNLRQLLLIPILPGDWYWVLSQRKQCQPSPSPRSYSIVTWSWQELDMWVMLQHTHWVLLHDSLQIYQCVCKPLGFSKEGVWITSPGIEHDKATWNDVCGKIQSIFRFWTPTDMVGLHSSIWCLHDLQEVAESFQGLLPHLHNQTILPVL